MSYADLNDSRHVEVLRRVAATTPFIPKYRSTVRKITIDADLLQQSYRTVADEGLAVVPAPTVVAATFAASKEEVIYVAKATMRMQSRAVSIQAPPGVGKSTLMPRIIDAEVAEPVMVLEPTEVLAQAQVSAVRSMGGTAEYVNPASAEYRGIDKSMGVIYTTPAGMLAKLKRDSYLATEDRTAVVVIHDECHENDGATYALRSLWPKFEQIRKYVLTSATLATQSKEAQQRHNSAPALKIVPCAFKDEMEFTASDTMSDGTPAPWSIHFLRGKKTLMFLERDKVADFVGAVYSHFMPVHVLRRDSSYADYEDVARACQTAGAEGVLVVVDSAYQTGYSFDVDILVDFGVRRQTVDSGVNQPQDYYREVTAAERRQRVERVARMRPGLAYVPDKKPSAASSVLGPGEAGHAAAWCRFLGYGLPAALKVDRAHLLDEADFEEFFKSQLPWDLWSREFFKARVLVETPALDEQWVDSQFVRTCSDEEPLSIEAMMDWAGGLRAEVVAAALKSGEFYSMEDGSLVADASTIDAISGGAGDMYTWLRERVVPQSVRRLADYTPVEASMVWAVWLTAWNTNVAKLVALTRWKSSYGAIPDDWHLSSVNRSVAANLFGMAEDVRDKWQLLKQWYGLLFAAHPQVLLTVGEVTDLVEAQYRAVRAVLGGGMAEKSATAKKKPIPGEVRYLLTGDTSTISSNSFMLYGSGNSLVTLPRKAVALSKIEAYDGASGGDGCESAPWGSPERRIDRTRDVATSGSVAKGRDSGGGSAVTYVFPKKPGGSGFWK